MPRLRIRHRPTTGGAWSVREDETGWHQNVVSRSRPDRTASRRCCALLCSRRSRACRSGRPRVGRRRRNRSNNRFSMTSLLSRKWSERRDSNSCHRVGSPRRNHYATFASKQRLASQRARVTPGSLHSRTHLSRHDRCPSFTAYGLSAHHDIHVCPNCAGLVWRGNRTRYLEQPLCAIAIRDRQCRSNGRRRAHTPARAAFRGWLARTWWQFSTT